MKNTWMYMILGCGMSLALGQPMAWAQAPKPWVASPAQWRALREDLQRLSADQAVRALAKGTAQADACTWTLGSDVTLKCTAFAWTRPNGATLRAKQLTWTDKKVLGTHMVWTPSSAQAESVSIKHAHWSARTSTLEGVKWTGAHPLPLALDRVLFVDAQPQRLFGLTWVDKGAVVAHASRVRRKGEGWVFDSLVVTQPVTKTFDKQSTTAPHAEAGFVAPTLVGARDAGVEVHQRLMLDAGALPWGVSLVANPGRYYGAGLQLYSLSPELGPSTWLDLALGWTHQGELWGGGFGSYFRGTSTHHIDGRVNWASHPQAQALARQQNTPLGLWNSSRGGVSGARATLTAQAVLFRDEHASGVVHRGVGARAALHRTFGQRLTLHLGINHLWDERVPLSQEALPSQANTALRLGATTVVGSLSKAYLMGHAQVGMNFTLEDAPQGWNTASGLRSLGLLEAGVALRGRGNGVTHDLTPRLVLATEPYVRQDQARPLQRSPLRLEPWTHATAIIGNTVRWGSLVLNADAWTRAQGLRSPSWSSGVSTQTRHGRWTMNLHLLKQLGPLKDAVTQWNVRATFAPFESWTLGLGASAMSVEGLWFEQSILARGMMIRTQSSGTNAQGLAASSGEDITQRLYGDVEWSSQNKWHNAQAFAYLSDDQRAQWGAQAGYTLNLVNLGWSVGFKGSLQKQDPWSRGQEARSSWGATLGLTRQVP